MSLDDLRKDAEDGTLVQEMLTRDLPPGRSELEALLSAPERSPADQILDAARPENTIGWNPADDDELTRFLKVREAASNVGVDVREHRHLWVALTTLDLYGPRLAPVWSTVKAVEPSEDDWQEVYAQADFNPHAHALAAYEDLVADLAEEFADD